MVGSGLAKHWLCCEICVPLCLMRFKKLLTFGLIAFGLFFLIQSPAEAARLVKVTGESAGEWFETAAHSLAKFVKTLV